VTDENSNSGNAVFWPTPTASPFGRAFFRPYRAPDLGRSADPQLRLHGGHEHRMAIKSSHAKIEIDRANGFKRQPSYCATNAGALDFK
jgi:hypothetical protein